MKKIVGIIITVLIFQTSCHRNLSENEPYTSAKAYCPLQVGHYITYKVVDTLLKFGNVVEPLAYEMKIKIAEKLDDQTVLEKYTLERYKRADANATWTLDSIWAATYNRDQELVVYEASIPFVKLVSPFKTGITWNGNKYNILAAEVYRTRAFGRPYYALDTVFDNTVKIVQNEDFENRFGYSNNYEVYAKDLGLVHKLYRTYRYSQDDKENVDPSVRVGFIRELKYLSHGQE